MYDKEVTKVLKTTIDSMLKEPTKILTKEDVDKMDKDEREMLLSKYSNFKATMYELMVDPGEYEINDIIKKLKEIEQNINILN